VHNAEASAGREETVRRARVRALRRARLLDVLVASTLLLLLIFGWAVRFAATEQRPGESLLATSGPPHR
jgi:hypothetical protein